ncbi:MAG TPA: lactate utilization protein [Deltaproteobacteria bacterium]|nr:lactate utilization protein [Deltaproteobacteria bacterium]
MQDYRSTFWGLKLETVKKELEANRFEAFVAETEEDARSLVLESIIPALNAGSVAWGGSTTVREVGLYEPLKEERYGLQINDTYDRSIAREELAERRRRALLSDLFITGTNAVTETGVLVNLDMIGNRVAAITFGPRWVIILVGRNKIVPDVDEAMERIRNYAAPANAMKLGMDTPCAKTAVCNNCDSPARICNSWTITEKSFPAGRIKVVLINRDLGL